MLAQYFVIRQASPFISFMLNNIFWRNCIWNCCNIFWHSDRNRITYTVKEDGYTSTIYLLYSCNPHDVKHVVCILKQMIHMLFIHSLWYKYDAVYRVRQVVVLDLDVIDDERCRIRCFTITFTICEWNKRVLFRRYSFCYRFELFISWFFVLMRMYCFKGRIDF